MADTENKTYIYYFSDPDSTDTKLHHLEIPLQFPIDDLPWHWHTEKPSEDLSDPIWDVKTNGWVENDKNNQGAILATQQEQIKNLITVNDKLQKDNSAKDGQISQLQDAISQSNQATYQLTQQFNSFGQQITAGMSQLADGVNQLTKKINGDDKPADDKAEDGGNK